MTLRHNNKAFLLSFPHVSMSKTRLLKSSTLLSHFRAEMCIRLSSNHHHSFPKLLNNKHIYSVHTQLTTFHDQIAWISHYQPPNLFTYSLVRFMSHCFEPTQGYWSTSNTKKKPLPCKPDIHTDKTPLKKYDYFDLNVYYLSKSIRAKGKTIEWHE